MAKKRTKKRALVGHRPVDIAEYEALLKKGAHLSEFSKQAPDDHKTHTDLWLKHMTDHAEMALLAGTFPKSGKNVLDSDIVFGAPGARLPTTAEERKSIPLAGVLDYFPDALCDVAKVIKQGQVQHSTDRWDRSKSTDHADCLQRHFLERGSKDVDGLRHSAKMVWRALALLQIELEAELGLGPSRGSK